MMVITAAIISGTCVHTISAQVMVVVRRRVIARIGQSVFSVVMLMPSELRRWVTTQGDGKSAASLRVDRFQAVHIHRRR